MRIRLMSSIAAARFPIARFASARIRINSSFLTQTNGALGLSYRVYCRSELTSSSWYAPTSLNLVWKRRSGEPSARAWASLRKRVLAQSRSGRLAGLTRSPELTDQLCCAP